jgi:sugar phosphate isomerase/epimerase
MKLQSTRRTFLGAAAGIAGLTATGVTPASAKIVPEPWGIKLGIASYTFRKFDRAKMIELVKQVQTPWLSVKQDFHWKMTLPADEQQKIKQEFQAAGIKVMSAGNTDLKALTADGLRPAFVWAKAAGVPMLVSAPLHENLKVIEGLVKEYDVKVAIHNHGPEDKNFPTPKSVLDAVRDLDPRIGLCMDVGHSARAGADVVESIAAAGSRLLDMHVKDLSDFHQGPGVKPGDLQVDCGDGVMPFAQIFKQLKKMNYQGCVNLEYEINVDNPIVGVQRSFSFMRGVLSGLAVG